MLPVPRILFGSDRHGPCNDAYSKRAGGGQNTEIRRVTGSSLPSPNTQKTDHSGLPTASNVPPSRIVSRLLSHIISRAAFLTSLTVPLQTSGTLGTYVVVFLLASGKYINTASSRHSKEANKIAEERTTLCRLYGRRYVSQIPQAESLFHERSRDRLKERSHMDGTSNGRMI